MKLIIVITVCFLFMTAVFGHDTFEMLGMQQSQQMAGMAGAAGCRHGHGATKHGMQAVNAAGDQMNNGSQGKTNEVTGAVKKSGGVMTKEAGRR